MTTYGNYVFFKKGMPLLNCHHVSKRESTFSACLKLVVKLVVKLESRNECKKSLNFRPRTAFSLCVKESWSECSLDSVRESGVNVLSLPWEREREREWEWEWMSVIEREYVSESESKWVNERERALQYVRERKLEWVWSQLCAWDWEVRTCVLFTPFVRVGGQWVSGCAFHSVCEIWRWVNEWVSEWMCPPLCVREWEVSE